MPNKNIDTSALSALASHFPQPQSGMLFVPCSGQEPCECFYDEIICTILFLKSKVKPSPTPLQSIQYLLIYVLLSIINVTLLFGRHIQTLEIKNENDFRQFPNNFTAFQRGSPFIFYEITSGFRFFDWFWSCFYTPERYIPHIGTPKLIGKCKRPRKWTALEQYVFLDTKNLIKLQKWMKLDEFESAMFFFQKKTLSGGGSDLAL